VPGRLRAIGNDGEDLAAAWYQAHGYEVVVRNWRCRDGEIDLVARRGGITVICEVKARSSAAFGAPVEAVTRTKQLRLRRLAAQYLSAVPDGRRGEVRFDVASVLAGKVEVVENAF
jgi:putative endonuclease